MEKTYKQSVVFHNYPYGMYIKLYRGGFDRENKKGMDPCNRSETPVEDIIKSRISYFWHSSDTYPMKRGVILSAMNKYDNSISKEQFIRVGKFFFGEDFEEKIADIKEDEFIAVDGEWMLVFSHCNELVLYKKTNDSFVPKKVTKECTQFSKFYQTWNRFGSYIGKTNRGKYTVKGYDFGKVDFVITGAPSHYREFLPEYGKTVEMKSMTEPWEAYSDRIYELPPIDLSKSWAYTKEEEAEFEEEAEKRIQEIRENERKLEERKHTPGYCELCGEPADYVVDPYDEDINNITVYRWLCPDCLSSIAGDI